jgi:hypothetical protein
MPLVRIFITRTHSVAHVNYHGERESLHGTLVNVVQAKSLPWTQTTTMVVEILMTLETLSISCNTCL